ncbi:MAG: 3-dehydroquinate synthase [Thiotrichaceae bacterium]|nr:3-dehydroquinate synthase [Thiotrichaceae bacterium]
MKTLTVDLGDRSYPIFIGQNLLAQKQLVTPYVKAKQVMIVSNETIAPLYLEQTLALFSDFQIEQVILPDGEEYKNLTVLNNIFDELLTKRCDRQVTLVALGGGVIGDMTGFAAACYQRGVPFIQIPTTLLAQVDSSVGGKTGVNHPQGKNMIGAFHQPQCVLIDTETLKTLEPRQLSAGLAEVVKYGLINDAEFFAWLEQNIQNLLNLESTAIAYAVERSCLNKANVVAQDEKEKGLRALLNLGHTFGHTIEAGLGYGQVLHGEAVAIGMVLAAKMSHSLGWIDAESVARTEAILLAMNLPITIPKEMSVKQILELMQVDKKVQAGKIRLILMKGIGQSLVVDDYPADVLQQTLENGF